MIEDSVCAVKFATLEGECTDAVGPYADEVVEDDGGGGVMRAIVIFIEQFLLIVLLVLFPKTGDTLGPAVAAHVFAEIPIGKWLLVVVSDEGPG